MSEESNDVMVRLTPEGWRALREVNPNAGPALMVMMSWPLHVNAARFALQAVLYAERQCVRIGVDDPPIEDGLFRRKAVCVEILPGDDPVKVAKVLEGFEINTGGGEA